MPHYCQDLPVGDDEDDQRYDELPQEQEESVPLRTAMLRAPLLYCKDCAYALESFFQKLFSKVITLRAKLSGAVYCHRSCLWVCVCLWAICYHDNSKLRASIFTKLDL